MSLKLLKEKADKLANMKDIKEYHEKRVYLINREIRMLEQEQIPYLLLEEGITNCVLDDGRQISITQDVSVSIKDKPAFYKFLEGRNEADHIKSVAKFDKMPTDKRKALLEFITNGNYGVIINDEVHHQTARSYFRKLLEVEPKQESVVEAFAKVSHFWRTKIRQTK